MFIVKEFIHEGLTVNGRVDPEANGLMDQRPSSPASTLLPE